LLCCLKYFPGPIESFILGDELRLETTRMKQWQAGS
jgi:hypothetical protein